jgi:hypothetical protein
MCGVIAAVGRHRRTLKARQDNAESKACPYNVES